MIRALYSTVAGVVTVGIFAASGMALAAKGGGGKPPNDDPPPSECTDEFPSFAFTRASGGRSNSTTSIYLSSADGCRTELLVEQAGVVHDLHLNPNQSAVFWDGPDYSVYRTGFTVEPDGAVTAGSSEQLLPTSEELGELAEGQEYWYLLPEIWGDPDSSTAYISVLRDKVDTTSDPNQDEQLDWVIYEVDATGVQDQRVMLADILVDGGLTAFSPYGCPNDVVHPQQVPGCFSLGIDPQSWNPTGTHLYVMGEQGDVAGTSVAAYRAMMRLNTTNRDEFSGELLSLDQWFADPIEMVYMGTFALNATFDEPGGAAVRPKADEAEDEFIGMDYLDRSGQFTVGADAVLNADECVDAYALFSDGKTYGPVDDILWASCFAPNTEFYIDHLESSIADVAWQSPDAILETAKDGSSRKATSNIYRRYVSGITPAPGTTELVIESGFGPNTGY